MFRYVKRNEPTLKKIFLVKTFLLLFNLAEIHVKIYLRKSTKHH